MTEKKKILFISYDGMTDQLGQSQVIPYVTGLTQYGYAFTILSCDKPERFEKDKKYVSDLLKPYPVNWVSIPYHKNPPVLSSLFDFYNLKKKSRQLHRKIKFDMVHARTGMPTLVALWMKKKYGIKFLNDLREFYADSRVDGKMWNLKNPLYKIIYNFFKKKEEEAIAINDGIVCLTFSAKKIIRQWPYYKHNIPLQVIPCSADLNLFDPEKINSTVKEKYKTELNISPDDFIISYLGSIGSWYLTDEVMQFLRIINNKMPRAKFLFITPQSKSIIEAAAEKWGVSSAKIIVKTASRHQVPVLLSLSSYSIFFIRPCYSKLSSSPTRHGEIMAMGIPVITNTGVGDIAEIVNIYNSGFLINDFNPSEYERISEIIFLGNIFNKEEIRNGAKDYYSLTSAIKKYANIYEQILSK